jgi:NNP family nitrate/nitrite transporter-like MFS transporter
MFGVAQLPGLGLAIAILFIAMACLGMGNGAVFQLVPQRFQKQIGMITGIVGAAGGIGGFFVPNLLGTLKSTTNTYATGFIAFSAIILVALTVLVVAQQTWKRTWNAQNESVKI